jgi:hypothetical protein
MRYTLLAASILAEVYAFPFVADMPGVDSSLFGGARSVKRQQTGAGPGSAASCPFNSNHVPAVGISDAYPYGGAKNGSAGTGKGMRDAELMCIWN